MEEQTMIIANSIEQLESLVKEGTHVFFFTADWCGDCQYIKPMMPEIEADFPQFSFVQVDRDDFIDVAQEWDIFGIPSFVAIKDGKEIGRLVSKNRKTKEEIEAFLKDIAL